MAYISKWFGCCAWYVECSDAMKCINPDTDHAKYCSYRQNLEAGRIFYGKNAGKVIEPEPEPIRQVFLHCYDRLFAITCKHKKNNYSYELKQDQVGTIITLFDRLGIPYSTTMTESECMSDGPTDDDTAKANSRVVMALNDTEFYIYNHNYFLIKAWRAGKIAKSLLAKGINARAETVASSYTPSKSDYVKQETRVQPKPTPAAKPQYKQLSIFDTQTA